MYFKQEKKSLSPPKWKLRNLCPQNISNSARLFLEHEKTSFKVGEKGDRLNFAHCPVHGKQNMCIIC